MIILLERVAKMVDALGKNPIGWDPIDTSPEIQTKGNTNKI